MKVKQTKSETVFTSATTDIKTVLKEEGITDLSNSIISFLKIYHTHLKPSPKWDEQCYSNKDMKEAVVCLYCKMTARMTVGKGCFYECI